MSAPGWYPDPGGQGQRYFDGTNWTDQRAPAPPAPPQKSRAWLWVLLSAVGVGVLFFGGCVAFVGMVASNVEDSSGPAATREAAGTIGSEVRDGKFAFIVESVGPAANWYGAPQPRGRWVIATVKVANVGNEPQSFFVQNQKLIDAAGREYAADSSAARQLNADTMVLDLGPGFALSVKIPFDIPTSATPAALVLHDSMLSSGVKVDV